MPEQVVAIIPARLASTRFPRKVLAARTGRPLIQHVVDAAAKSAVVHRVVVATDADEVARAVRGFGGEVVLTREDHPNGTSRLAEAAASLGLGARDIVVNVQGDEPEIDPGLIDAAVQALRTSDAPVATVASPFGAQEDPANPNIVKAVVGRNGLALYFTRALAPFPRDGTTAAGAGPFKHVGLYVYRREFLETYVRLAPTPLEETEKLEQLRVLEHGHAIAVAICASRHVGIDTPEQYDAFVERWEQKHAGR